jgi:hypothetical protein
MFIEIINPSLALKLKRDLLPYVRELTFFDLVEGDYTLPRRITRYQQENNVVFEIKIYDEPTQFVLIPIKEINELKQLHSLIKKFWKPYKLPIKNAINFNIQKYLNIISKNTQAFLDESQRIKRKTIHSLLSIPKTIDKYKILTELSPKMDRQSVSYFQKLNAQTFMARWKRVQERLNFKKSEELLDYLMSFPNPQPLLEVIMDWEYSFSLGKLYLLTTHFFEDHSVVGSIFKEDEIYLLENCLLSLTDGNYYGSDYLESLLGIILRFSKLFHLLDMHYSLSFNDQGNLKLLDLMDSKISRALITLKKLQNKNRLTTEDLKYFFDILNHVKILDYFPGNIPLKNIFILERFLEEIKDNPYFKKANFKFDNMPLGASYLSEICNRFSANKMISEDWFINESIKNLLSSTKHGLPIYEQRLSELENVIKYRQIDNLDLLPTNRKKHMTKIIFRHLIHEVFLKPHNIIKQEHPHIVPNDLLWRTARLLHGIMEIKGFEP